MQAHAPFDRPIGSGKRQYFRKQGGDEDRIAFHNYASTAARTAIIFRAGINAPAARAIGDVEGGYEAFRIAHENAIRAGNWPGNHAAAKGCAGAIAAGPSLPQGGGAKRHMPARMARGAAKLRPQAERLLRWQGNSQAARLGIRLNRTVGKGQDRFALSCDFHAPFAENTVQGFTAGQKPGRAQQPRAP